MAKSRGGIRKMRPENPSLQGLQNDPRFYDRTTERAYVFNEDGSLNYTISQHITNSVEIPPEIIPTMKDKILLHNHPIPILSMNPLSGFSLGDVFLTYHNNLLEIRATNVIGTYTLRRPKGGWGNEAKLEDAINSSRTPATISDGSWARDFANKVGATYAFIPR